MALTKQHAIEALQATGGNVSAAARALGVTRQTLYNKINQHEDVAEILDEARHELVDIAEDQLKTLVRKGNMTAVAFTLNNSPEAKRRGWGPRQEVAGVEDKPLNVVIQWPEADA